MTNRKIGRSVLVVLAIVGLAFAAPGVSAHGDESPAGNETAADGMPADGDAAAWAAWMNGHMLDQMGPGAVAEMESYMGVTVDEMAQDMADGKRSTAGMTSQGHDC